jgi:outer membrane protein, heavy metal efflux system
MNPTPAVTSAFEHDATNRLPLRRSIYKFPMFRQRHQLERATRWSNCFQILDPNSHSMAPLSAHHSAAVGGRLASLRAGRVWSVSSRATSPVAALAIALVITGGLTGCASYRPLPLPQRADLDTSLVDLETGVAEWRAGYALRRIDTSHPLSIERIGVLAILNDPDLKSERGAIDEARSGLVQASLLPNPVANFSYGALISGPGTTSSISAFLSQDIAAIISHGPRVKSAVAHLYQVDADQLWREWQVAQKARQLALDIYLADLSISLTAREQQLLSRELVAVRKAIAAGNLTLTALAPLLTAAAAAEQSLVALRLDRLKNWQALDGLLGLVPSVRFAIARPRFNRLPADIEPLIADLPERRPDLGALRLGYRSAEEDVRAAILGQFPALTLGGSYNSDTSAVVSAGPVFTFALPVFDRNQGQIAKSLATRLQLRAQYQARLDSAVANIRALIAQIHQLSADLVAARKAAAEARSLAVTARQAYAQNNLDQRTLTDYETTALQRAIEVVTIERQIDEDKIFLAVELGLGLPKTRIALSGRALL